MCCNDETRRILHWQKYRAYQGAASFQKHFTFIACFNDQASIILELNAYDCPSTIRQPHAEIHFGGTEAGNANCSTIDRWHEPKELSAFYGYCCNQDICIFNNPPVPVVFFLTLLYACTSFHCPFCRTVFHTYLGDSNDYNIVCVSRR